jgi:hypothetical protein
MKHVVKGDYQHTLLEILSLFLVLLIFFNTCSLETCAFHCIF